MPVVLEYSIIYIRIPIPDKTEDIGKIIAEKIVK